MHSSKFTALARAADERGAVIVSMVEDVAANAESTAILGAVILHMPPEGETGNRFSFARFVISSDDEVTFEGEQVVYSNMSKAFKFLSDYTLDRRPFVHMEDGTEVESRDGEKSTPATA